MKQIRNIIRAELREVFLQSRSLLMLFFLVFSYETVLAPMRTLSSRTGFPVQWTEPFLLLCTRSTNIVLIPVIYTALLTKFPRCSTSYFQMIRLTKKRWLIGELLFLLIFAVFTVFVIFAGTLITMRGRITFSTDWSPYLLELPVQ